MMYALCTHHAGETPRARSRCRCGRDAREPGPGVDAGETPTIPADPGISDAGETPRARRLCGCGRDAASPADPGISDAGETPASRDPVWMRARRPRSWQPPRMRARRPPAGTRCGCGRDARDPGSLHTCGRDAREPGGYVRVRKPRSSSNVTIRRAHSSGVVSTVVRCSSGTTGGS